MSLAWHTAALPQMKKFPKLADMVGKPKPKPRRKKRLNGPASADHLFSMAQRWTSATNGDLG